MHIDFESAAQDGTLVLLLEVTVGPDVFRYCSGGRDYSAMGETWLSVQGLEFGDINQTDNAKETPFKVNLPFDDPLLVKLQGYISVKVQSKLFSIYVDDPDQQALTEFVGFDCNITSTDRKAEILFNDELKGTRRNGLANVYSPNCTHGVYQKGCNLDRANFAVPGTMTALAGKIATVAEAALLGDNEYSYGILELASGQEIYILAQQGDQLTLSDIDSAELVPQAVNLYRGCDQTEARCLTFNNTENNAGMWFLAENNPFDGSIF